MIRSKDYFMSDVCLPDEVRIGCVSFRGLRELPLSTVYVCIEDNEISITFWSALPEPWKGNSLVHLGIFRLPMAAAKFQSEVERYREARAKRKVRLPDGPPFEPNTLAIPDLPAAWEHEGFASTSRDLVHIYWAPGCAVLVRSFSPSGTMLNHPLLKPLNDHLRLHAEQWIEEFPEAQPLSRPVAILESELAPEVAGEINEAITRACQSLGLAGQHEAMVIIERVSTAIDEIRARKRVAAAEKKQLAIQLGCLWGDTLRRENQWEWCVVHPDPGRTVYAVCHPSRSHAVDPIAFVHRILSSKRNANTSALLFNMIVAGDLPEAPPRTYSWQW